MTPIDPIAEWIEPNVQIENVVYGRGKARNSARTSVAGIGYAMTRRLGEAMAVAEQGQPARFCTSRCAEGDAAARRPP